MKKLFFLGIALLAGVSFLFAQTSRQAAEGESSESHARRLYVAPMGSVVLDIYENAFSYRENNRDFELVTLQAGLALGYDFTDSFGLRLSAAYGNDAAAGNVRQTAGGGFYPYSFHHVNAFLDGVLNLNGLAGRITKFRPKLYGGLGGAYTFGFTDAKHPWQKINDPNTVFGFRLGFIAEYTFDSGLGLFGDLCGEAYTDMYNGLMPTKEEQKDYEGYGGFPLDLRSLLSFGFVYHF